MGIEKHIQITGRSTISWKDAIVKTLEEVARLKQSFKSGDLGALDST